MWFHLKRTSDFRVWTCPFTRSNHPIQTFFMCSKSDTYGLTSIRGVSFSTSNRSTYTRLFSRRTSPIKERPIGFGRLGAFIDFFISSCFVHYRKPDGDIYRIALDIAQVIPQQVVYIDDQPMFVEVAQSLEIKGILHKDYETTQQALEAMGLALGIWQPFRQFKYS